MANEYRIDALAVEAFVQNPVNARIDALAVEAFVQNPVNARIDAMAVEVWRTIASVSPRRRNAGMVI